MALIRGRYKLLAAYRIENGMLAGDPTPETCACFLVVRQKVLPPLCGSQIMKRPLYTSANTSGFTEADADATPQSKLEATGPTRS